MVASLVTQLALSGGGGQIVTTATKVVIKPLEDRIVVRPLDAEQTTASGLVIPDTAKEKPQEGEVMAVGPGRFDDAGAKRVPMDVKVGDVVLYSKYGGTEVQYAGGAAMGQATRSGPPRRSRTAASRSQRRPSGRTGRRTWAPSSPRKSPPRPTTGPATAPPPPPCSRRRWCTRDCVR